jgi:hypothetical protein
MVIVTTRFSNSILSENMKSVLSAKKKKKKKKKFQGSVFSPTGCFPNFKKGMMQRCLSLPRPPNADFRITEGPAP